MTKRTVGLTREHKHGDIKHKMLDISWLKVLIGSDCNINQLTDIPMPQSWEPLALPEKLSLDNIIFRTAWELSRIMPRCAWKDCWASHTFWSIPLLEENSHATTGNYFFQKKHIMKISLSWHALHYASSHVNRHFWSS